ncbi:MAG: NAD-dependent deacylase [Firmicutes bacterium]|nr:NAD-dependent deacylase [Bacillota bacterium]
MKKIFQGKEMELGVSKLASMLKEANKTVILTGAGMDTESNIPDFRSKNGWWRQIDPRLVASTNSLYNDYSTFHEFYLLRIKLLEGIMPHRGHYVLADLEKAGLLESIITQNVAGLHTLAGNKNVYELHGNIRSIRCDKCGEGAKIEDFFAGKDCRACGQRALRPNVVLFGEALPPKVWEAALADIESCDLLLVIGTSLEVYPVNQLPLWTRGKTVLINNEDRGAGYSFDLKIIGRAGEVLGNLSKALASL